MDGRPRSCRFCCPERRLPYRTVLTPHSLAFQGNFWSYDFALTICRATISAHGVEYYGSMNCLKGGILFAHAVVLPSERYVWESQTPEHGYGLENVLREHQHSSMAFQPANRSKAGNWLLVRIRPAAFCAARDRRTFRG